MAPAWLASPRRVPALLAGVALLWCGLLVAAPFMIPPGTVTDLDGVENRVDHFALWFTLPPVPAVVYAVGDLLCHQKDWRSFHLNGNALPIDERMTAIFAAASVFLVVAATRVRASVFVTDVMQAALPQAWQRRLPTQRPRVARVFAIVVTLALAPAAVDVLWENLLGRESTMPLRVVTGVVAGVAGAWVLAAFAVSTDVFARVVWSTSVRPRVAPRLPRVARVLDALFTPPAAASRQSDARSNRSAEA